MATAYRLPIGSRARRERINSKIMANALKKRFKLHLFWEMPVLGVVSGVLARKEGRRDANPNMRDACAPQQKSFAQWVLRIFKGNGSYCVCLAPKWIVIFFAGKYGFPAAPSPILLP